MYEAHFAVQERWWKLKKIAEKKQTAEFRKRISAKTAVFSAFKSIGQSVKANDTLTARRRRALAKVKVSCCTPKEVQSVYGWMK